MICEEFDQLNAKEKTEFIGKLVHSVQSDPDLYSMAQKIIEMGEEKGLFEGVKILHPNTKDV